MCWGEGFRSEGRFFLFYFWLNSLNLLVLKIVIVLGIWFFRVFRSLFFFFFSRRRVDFDMKNFF